MKYKEAIQRIDTKKAMTSIGLNSLQSGHYLKFQCQCGGSASIKLYGLKKNLWYCEGCKTGGNIVGLAMKTKNLEFQEAKNFLLEKADSPQPIGEPLQLDYELEFCSSLGEKGLPKEITQLFEVGRPKGKTMLSGCLAFAVRNDKGYKIAYYGIKPDGTPKFHSSFNPETILYVPVPLDFAKEVILTTDMVKCLIYTFDGKQACSNFGLPYLSQWHLDQLSQCEYLSIDWQFEKREIATMVAELKCYHRFI
jgi:hypothetical protein